MTLSIALADENHAEFQRELARWSPNAALTEQDGLLFVLAADPFPAVNMVLPVSGAGTPSAATIVARASAYFAQHKRAFSIRARAHVDHELIALCKSRDMFLLGDSPGMGITAPIAELAVSPEALGIELRVARDEAAIRDFAQVCAVSYATLGMPLPVAHAMFAVPSRMLADHLHVVTAYDKEQPVCTAMALLSHGIGGIYWVGTVPSARKRGLAAHCTRAVSNWCFEQGARSVILQASTQGDPIYRALGFQELTRYPWFLCMGNA